MQNFDYLRVLGKDLAHQTRNKKHPFQECWIDNLTEIYNERKGIKLVHLSDINKPLYLKLNENGKNLLQKTEKSSAVLNKNSKRSVRLYLRSEDKFISLRNIKAHLGERIDLLQPHVIEIKTTKSGIGKTIKNPKFPIKLDSELGALFLGNYPDASMKSGEFFSKDKELFSDLIKYYGIYVGYTKPTLWKSNIDHMQLSGIIPMLYEALGLEIYHTQIFSNNALPHWVFHSSSEFQRILLRRLWDTEGSAPVCGKMCLGQSVVLKEIEDYIPLYPERKSFTDCRDKEKILGNPPNLLVSAQLLLYKFGIVSCIKPHRLYRKKNGWTVCDWHLTITRYPNLKKFSDEIGFGLKRKQDKLTFCINSYKRNYLKSRSERENEIIDSINAMNIDTFTIAQLRGKINISEGAIRSYLIRMSKKRRIEKIGTVRQEDGSSFYNKYKILR